MKLLIKAHEQAHLDQPQSYIMQNALIDTLTAATLLFTSNIGEVMMEQKQLQMQDGDCQRMSANSL